MILHVSANLVCPVFAPAIKNGVIALQTDGTIVNVYHPQEAEAKGITNIVRYNGVLVPGFINTHCHLELSHLFGKIPQKTGLIDFIKGVLAFRQQPEDQVLMAMQEADEQMFANGIVAVGDISNELISKNVKQQSKVFYHTFLELFGFNKSSVLIIAQGLALKNEFLPLKASLVPHAPYSVSTDLLNAIALHTKSDDVLSIHNQETLAENEFFEKGSGGFFEFLGAANLLNTELKFGKSSIHYHVAELPKKVNTLLVHNTFTSKADVEFAQQSHPNLYWCLCPNANLYIENTLPADHLLQDETLNITLGTDSLASNHQLSILAEMQVLQERKNISFHQSLKWATLNGAKFLGIDAQYGSFEVGKKPGLVLLGLNEDAIISKNSTIKRLF